jgi:hypothetical protein
MTQVPALYRSLCDDAALFPPGNAPLADALAAHFHYRTADFAELVGGFVCPAERLSELRHALAATTSALELTLTVPAGPAMLVGALADLEQLQGVALRTLEIAVPANATPYEFFADLAAAGLDPEVDVYVETPRDSRREPVLDGIAAAGLRAKFRTGGIHAELYPSEQELADSIRRATDRDIAFKATAGLHHAIRNTDPVTGFEQHGFLNLMLAAAASAADMETLLAMRDPVEIVRRIGDLEPSVRSRFISYGTCSIGEPLTELIDLGLLPASLRVEGVTA